MKKNAKRLYIGQAHLSHSQSLLSTSKKMMQKQVKKSEQTNEFM